MTLTRFLKHPFLPLILLLAVNLAAGFLTFQHYGMSWDEPLFYDYADSIRLAYTPAAYAPGFDFYQVFGKSPEDHKIYGPAYLLLARPIEQGIMALGVDMASAWHLVNFLTFQVGLAAFYFLARRWLEPWPAAAATAFLAWQPVYWGHAFINPKDAPFMVFFLWALVLGLDMADRFSEQGQKHWASLVLAGLALGLTSAIRVIGPLAGAIVFIYFLLKKNWRAFPLFIVYGLIAMVTMFIFWPYLWFDPINRLLEVLKHMSNNPTELAVLFDGQIFRANEMPRRYLPQVFALTLTEPTWILFFAGIIVAIRSFFTKRFISRPRVRRTNQLGENSSNGFFSRLNKLLLTWCDALPLHKQVDWRSPLVVLGLFVFMLAYLLYNKPSVYDGFRHFFFITPPVFVFIGFSLQWLWEKLKPALWTAVMVLVLLPGLIGIIRLHPYEYAYYNLFAGGVGGAYRVYETEYWLTCYKEALEWTRANAPNTTLHIQREFSLAEYYAAGLRLRDLGKETENNVQPGDLLLFHTRGDLDIRSNYRKLPIEHVIGRDGAEFCIIKRKN